MARIDLARAHRIARRTDRAHEELSRLLSEHPSLPPAWNALGDVLVDLHRHADARRAYRRAHSLDPARERLTRGYAAIGRGEFRTAERLFRVTLQADPNHVGALCGLAAIHRGGGGFVAAERLLRHALRQTEHAPLVWRGLAHTLLEAGRLIEAEAAIRRALRVAPDDARCWIHLATICGRLHRPEAALEAYREAERLDPAHPLVHLSIGHVLKTLGRRTECEQAYHECIEQDAAAGEAYVSLAELKNYTFRDAQIAAMQDQLASGTGGDTNAARLHFALARAYEQRGACARAFAEYAAGNRLRQRAAPFDIAGFEAACRRVRAALDARFFAAAAGGGCPDPAPIFIVGLPRSGSTLVEQILASHPAVEGTMELPNIPAIVTELRRMNAREDAYPDSLAAAPAAVLEALGRRYLRETAPLRTGRRHFTDKLPNNFLHVGLIHAILPNATIVDVRRHPMDACFSCFKQYFAAGQFFTYDLEGLGRYYRCYLEVMDHWDAVLPGRVLHVFYEDLVREPHDQVRRLLAHCGLEFDPACLEFHRTRRPIRTASSEQVRQPLYTSGIGYWRRFERELQPLRRALGDTLFRFPVSYPPAVAIPRERRGGLRRVHSSATSALGAAIAGVLAAVEAPHALADSPADALDEVVVTARYRAEKVQDVPQNIDVFAAQDIQNLGIERLEDYLTLAPSIAFISTGPDSQRMFMRGVSDGSNPNFGHANLSTTGYLLDDLSFNYYGHIPDLHLYDVERIEVLNGPQGTAFGPGALSGAIRVVTNKPDPRTFSAGADFDGGQIDGGANDWTYEGYVNLPLVEGRSALRLSAYSVQEGGYIDNQPGTRHWLNGTVSTDGPWAGDNYNTRDIVGTRIGYQQNLPHDWSLTVTGYYQRQSYRGSWEEEPSRFGPLNLERYAPQGGYDYSRFLDLHVEGDVGIADLVYAGGYTAQRRRRLYDYSEYAQYSSYAVVAQSSACATDPMHGAGYSGCNVPYMYAVVSGLIQQWSNELRLQSKAGGRTHWTVGAYWEKIYDPYSGFIHLPGIKLGGEEAQYLIAAYGNLATPRPEEWYSDYGDDHYRQVTEFGDLTVDLDPRWSVEAGVRHYHSSVAETDTSAPYYAQKTPTFHADSSNRTNFKAGVSFKPSNHELLYFSFAQGYRDGGFNYISQYDNPSFPRYFKPDHLDSYELGAKSDFLGGQVVWNSALYYMSWADYQVRVDVAEAPFSFNANAGDARIYGFESNIEVRPAAGITLSFDGNYNDARIKSSEYQSPAYTVVAGERLPEAPYFNFSAAARYERPLGSAWRAFSQVDAAHKGDMWNDLREATRTLQQAYTICNVRAGVTHSPAGLAVEAYVSNAGNKRAVIFANYTGYSHPDIPTAPRVFGLRLSYRWGQR